jgi:hypothetical protein
VEKKMNRNVVVVLLLVVSVLSGLSQASITNGNFSDPTLAPWTASPSDLVTLEGGKVKFEENYSGDRFSLLTQTFDSTGGEQTISFDYQMFSGPGEFTTDVFTAYLNNVAIFDVNNDDSLPSTIETFSTNVQLLVGNNTVEFRLFSDPYDTRITTVLLDNVVLTPTVPVPPAMLLVGLGAASVGWLRRRRAL